MPDIPIPEPPARPLTVADAAAELGITKQSIRNYVARGDVVGYLPEDGAARGLRVDPDEVRRHLERREQERREAAIRRALAPSKRTSWSKRYGDQAVIVPLRTGEASK